MKTTVFLTGATGTMGFAGMTEILRYPERYDLRILARPSEEQRAAASHQYSAFSAQHYMG